MCLAKKGGGVRWGGQEKGRAGGVVVKKKRQKKNRKRQVQKGPGPETRKNHGKECERVTSGRLKARQQTGRLKDRSHPTIGWRGGNFRE